MAFDRTYLSVESPIDNEQQIQIDRTQVGAIRLPAVAPFSPNNERKAEINVNLLSQFIMQQIEQRQASSNTLAKY